MARRTSNKKAKQKMCANLNSINDYDGMPEYGYSFSRFYKPPRYEELTKYGLHFDGYEVKQGTVSIKGKV